MLLEEAVGLVLDVDGDVAEGLGMAPRVVAAEQELTHGQDHANVRLSVAAVATVGGGQRGGRRGSHTRIQPPGADILPVDMREFATRVVTAWRSGGDGGPD